MCPVVPASFQFNIMAVDSRLELAELCWPLVAEACIAELADRLAPRDNIWYATANIALHGTCMTILYAGSFDLELAYLVQQHIADLQVVFRYGDSKTAIKALARNLQKLGISSTEAVFDV